MSGEKKTRSTEETFIAAQLRAKASLGLTLIRNPDVANACKDQLEHPYSYYNKDTVYKMIRMLENQSNESILKLQSEINAKLDNGIKLSWGENITAYAVSQIIKSRNPK